MKLHFNGIMLSAANNSLHKTHCGCHKPCTMYSYNLGHILFIVQLCSCFWRIMACHAAYPFWLLSEFELPKVTLEYLLEFDWTHSLWHHSKSIIASFKKHINFVTFSMHDCIASQSSLYLASFFSLFVFVTIRTDLWEPPVSVLTLQCCNVPQFHDFWVLQCFTGFEVLFQTGSNRAASAAWLSNPRD